MVCAPVGRNNPQDLARGLSTIQPRRPCSISCCIMISSVELAHYRVSSAKDWVSVDCGRIFNHTIFSLLEQKFRRCYCYHDHFGFHTGWLTLLHSERPKLYGVLAVLSAVGLKFFIPYEVSQRTCFTLVHPFVPS